MEKEADVVIVGYGGAGAAAAVAAYDAGATVIILEKSAAGGGNTGISGGTIREYVDLGKASTYFEAISFGTVARDIIDIFVHESAEVPDWLKSLGARVERQGPLDLPGFPPAPHVVFGTVPGADGLGGRWRVKEGSGRRGGLDLCALLSRNVDARGIEVLLKTAAKQLVRNGDNQVVAVLADGCEGEVLVRSRRAVVLACGGFECDVEMLQNHLGFQLHALGNPANTGDGIRMAQEVGADLWHMSGVCVGLGYKVAEYDVPIGHRMRSGGYIYVDQSGKRFIDEAGTDMHAMAEAFCCLDRATLKYPRIPSHVIFDEDTRQTGPIADIVTGWMADCYRWSEDNTVEIERGWIKKAGTIASLATQIGVRSESLQETVARYNICCVGGYDSDFGRRPETLSRIARAPFYAIAVVPCLINTQGGPRRNGRSQVLDTHKQPIRRLYSAGELGSIWGIAYPGAGNVTECLAFGRIAGRNAAAEIPWK